MEFLEKSCVDTNEIDSKSRGKYEVVMFIDNDFQLDGNSACAKNVQV